MSEVNNSQRRFYNATYAPIQLTQSGDDMKKQALLTRCFEKLSFIQSLAIHRSEITHLRFRIDEGSPPIENANHLQQVLDTVEDIARIHLQAHCCAKHLDSPTLMGKHLSSWPTSGRRWICPDERGRVYLGANPHTLHTAIEQPPMPTTSTPPQTPGKVAEPIEAVAHLSGATRSNEIAQPHGDGGDENLAEVFLRHQSSLIKSRL